MGVDGIVVSVMALLVFYGVEISERFASQTMTKPRVAAANNLSADESTPTIADSQAPSRLLRICMATSEACSSSMASGPSSGGALWIMATSMPVAIMYGTTASGEVSTQRCAAVSAIANVKCCLKVDVSCSIPAALARDYVRRFCDFKYKVALRSAHNLERCHARLLDFATRAAWSTRKAPAQSSFEPCTVFGCSPEPAFHQRAWRCFFEHCDHFIRTHVENAEHTPCEFKRPRSRRRRDPEQRCFNGDLVFVLVRKCGRKRLNTFGLGALIKQMLNKAHCWIMKRVVLCCVLKDRFDLKPKFSTQTLLLTK